MNWNVYDTESHVAEIYDRSEDYADDVDLIRSLIGRRGPLRILEPFCGTGRILVPLAADGHELVGLDRAQGMLARAQAKAAALPEAARGRIRLVHADVLAGKWPYGFDVVILGGNCFYELATPEDQERCIALAAGSLKPGGHVYIDNNHMEGDLAKSWRQPGAQQGAFPSGTCADGTRVESTMEPPWWDAPHRLIRFRRTTSVTFPDGGTLRREYTVQKHPVSTHEVRGWLERHGSAIERLCGDRAGNPYTDAAGRAIFWARRAMARS